ncbi:Hypothetical protein D9617_1g085990 [Elsinoe fawcettii]|nr:Hypothetical protein D9617_1g085990 [Elsinoe fawcettii]
MEATTALALICNIIDLIKTSKNAYNTYQRFRAGQDVTNGLSTAVQDVIVANDRLQRSLKRQPGLGDPLDINLETYTQKLQWTSQTLADKLKPFDSRCPGQKKGRLNSFLRSAKFLRQDRSLREVFDQLLIQEQHLNHRLLGRISERFSSFGLKLDLHMETLDQLRELQIKHHDEQQDLRNKQYDQILEALRSCETELQAMKLESQRKEQDSSLRALQQRVLASLHFPAIDHRRESVSEAHQQTFRWVFDESGQQRKWDSLVDWLKDHERHDTFWISGKPGSGKSTLMSYIRTHSRFMELLEKCAGPSKKFVVLDFYFWLAGPSSLQRSIVGLLRTLLYRLLDFDPALAGAAFDFHFKEPEWTVAGLLLKIKTIIECAAEDHIFLVMIDGLDECTDSAFDLRFSLEKLVKMPQVRLLASSRPDRALEVFFDGSKMLRLQDLTAGDILGYCQYKLQYYSRHSDSIARFAAECSDGVFLWVDVIVNTVISGFEDGEDQDDLYRRIKQVPTQLDELYNSLLSKMGAQNSSRASKYFKLMLAKHHAIDIDQARTPEVTTLELATVEIMDRDENNDPVLSGRIADEVQSVRRFIATKCVHLADITPAGGEVESVSFFHRSAYEHFLHLYRREEVTGRRFQLQDEIQKLAFANYTLLRQLKDTMPSVKALQPSLEKFAADWTIVVPAWMWYLRFLDCGRRHAIEQLVRELNSPDSLLDSSFVRYDTAVITHQLGLTITLGLSRFLIRPLVEIDAIKNNHLLTLFLLQQNRSPSHCVCAPNCGSHCTQRPLCEELDEVLQGGVDMYADPSGAMQEFCLFSDLDSIPFGWRSPVFGRQYSIPLAFQEHFWPCNSLEDAVCNKHTNGDRGIGLMTRAEINAHKAQVIAEILRVLAQHGLDLTKKVYEIHCDIPDDVGVFLCIRCTFASHAHALALRDPRAKVFVDEILRVDQSRHFSAHLTQSKKHSEWYGAKDCRIQLKMLDVDHLVGSDFIWQWLSFVVAGEEIEEEGPLTRPFVKTGYKIAEAFRAGYLSAHEYICHNRPHTWRKSDEEDGYVEDDREVATFVHDGKRWLTIRWKDKS